MAHSRSQARARQAFSLVELLVVMVIIAILVSMLLPMVLKAREAANRAVCGSNLRQIGMGCLAYAGDFNCFPPQNSNPNFWSTRSVNGVVHGIGLLVEYLDSPKVMFCPGSLVPQNSIFTSQANQIRAHDWDSISCYGYTYHAGCRSAPDGQWADPPFANPPISLGQVTTTFKANDLMAISESQILGSPGSNLASSSVLAADWMAKFGNGGWFQNTAINHPGGGPAAPGRSGANAVHADGHVEWYSFPRDFVDDWWCLYALWKPSLMPNG